jgi:P4 family phage/plasmid primase-like protien
MSYGLAYNAALSFLTESSSVTATPETIRWRKRFFQHDGVCYHPVTDELVESAIAKWLARNPDARTEKGKLQPVTINLVRNAMLAVRSETSISDETALNSWLKAPPAGAIGPFLATPGGILDLGRLDKSGAVLLPNDPKFFTLASLPVTPDCMASCRMWLKFLADTFPCSPDAILLLQEIIGYSLWPYCDFERFFIYHGAGDTGKSTVAETHQALLGKMNVSALPLERFHERFALSNLIGKMANIVFDASEIDKLAEGVLKALVSGEPVTVEEKHCPVGTMRLTAKHILATNVLPRFHDTSTGTWRRLKLLVFEQVCPPEKRDSDLKNKLRTELPAIAHWALQGLNRLLQQRDFTTYAHGETLAAEYRRDSNPVALFLDAECLAEPDAHICRQVLYAHYKAWITANGFIALSSRNFYKQVEAIYPQPKDKVRDGRGGDRMFVGFRLQDRTGVAQQFRVLLSTNGKGA